MYQIQHVVYPRHVVLPSNSVGIPITFFNETLVQNIRTATAMAMYNPSAQNVDTLLNLLIDLMDTTNNTSFLHGQAAID